MKLSKLVGPGSLYGVLTLACIVAATGATALTARADATGNGRTALSDIPWDPAPLEAKDKVIYGEDNRLDVYEETDPDRSAWAAATCALVRADDLSDNGDGLFSLQTYQYRANGWAQLCADEPFINQPTAAFCSGFKVGDDLIATAGHCISEADLPDVRFLFGFDMVDVASPRLLFTEDYIYTGIEVVAWQHTFNYDYALIRVDRAITAPNATALPLRSTGEVAVGERVGLIGHPSGLPKKIAFGEYTKVRANSAPGYFSANLDAYGGNSGSPVFNAETGLVEGILVRGNRDFVRDGNCYRSSTLPDETTHSEEVNKSATFAGWVSDMVLPIPNDHCADALELVANAPWDGVTIGATGFMTTSCADGDTRDGWFSFIPETTGEYVISLCGSGFDTTLAVYRGGCESLEELACSDQWCHDQSQICRTFYTDESYLIRVAGHQGATGFFRLSITPTTLCPSEPDWVYADFTASPERGTPPLTVTFQNFSVNAANWLWDFGDGTSSDAWNPTHEYLAPGYYYARLDVWHDWDYDSWEVLIDVAASNVAAYFEATPTRGRAPLTVAFENRSENGEAWLWDFGDGNFSETWDATHVYELPGQYRVRLEVWDSTDLAWHEALIDVYAGATRDTPPSDEGEDEGEDEQRGNQGCRNRNDKSFYPNGFHQALADWSPATLSLLCLWAFAGIRKRRG